MSQITNRQWTVAEHPTAALEAHHFAYREAPVPELARGEVLLRTLALNIAPVMRMYMMAGGAAGEAPLQIGDVIHGRSVAQVVASRHPEYAEGEYVQAQTGWQTYKVSTLSEAGRVRRLPQIGLPVTYALAVLGMTGFSAYFGFLSRGEPKAGDKVLVSGAVGGVGSLVVQLARIVGCDPIVGIAGGTAKTNLARELGCTACIDYKSENVGDALDLLLADGIDLYFDNVGGGTLEAALERLRPKARVVLCGSISEYQREQPFGPRNYTRLRAAEADMRGFFVYNHAQAFDEAEHRLAGWLQSGELKPVIDQIEGFEHMPQALMDMYQGTLGGKRIVTVGEVPTY